jgi:hypothetical protein
MNSLLESLRFSYKFGDISLMTFAGFYIFLRRKGDIVKNFWIMDIPVNIILLIFL